MAHRSFESPMDFKWESGHGPSNVDSPFMKYTANHMQSQKSLAGQKRRNSNCMFSSHNSDSNVGDYDDFDSPKKPFLPASTDLQASYSLSTSTPKLPAQFRNPSFTTPRRQIETDFSSGPENQSSPLADNEDTPEQPLRNNGIDSMGAQVMFQGNKSDQKSPTKSIFGDYSTPGRAEHPRQDKLSDTGAFKKLIPYLSGRHYNDAVARRVLKRRRRDAEGRDVRLARHRPRDESDDEHNSRQRDSSPSKTIAEPQKIGTIPSILTFVHAHPDLPDILSRYAQFLLNLFFVALLMFVVYCFLATIRSDVDEASREVAAETMAEMVACTREFKANKCDSADRVPAMESMCNSWQKCMNRDPAMVGRARVSAQTFAEIITSFAEGISYKTMVRAMRPATW